MDIHINTVSQCTGGNHRHFDFTVNGGAIRRITLGKEELAVDKEDAITDRIRSALKEAGVNLTLTQWKTALEGKDFKV